MIKNIGIVLCKRVHDDKAHFLMSFLESTKGDKDWVNPPREVCMMLMQIAGVIVIYDKC